MLVFLPTLPCLRSGLRLLTLSRADWRFTWLDLGRRRIKELPAANQPRNNSFSPSRISFHPHLISSLLSTVWTRNIRYLKRTQVDSRSPQAMDPASTRPAPQEAPTIPPDALEAIAAPRAADALKRCFICLADQEPTDPPGSWVDPCPCTLEAHQDCMMSWVIDCERSNKPLQCPVCKERIRIEGPWDPIVALSEVVSKKFTRGSPLVLFMSLSMGVQFSMQMYGALAMWTFSGRDSLMRYMLGPDMMLDGRYRGIRVARERLGNALVLMNVGPALLLGHLAPWLGNKVFLPSASLYGVYHVLHDEHFFSWPPSPQLAMTIFPYIRSAYLNLYREFITPYEVSLNRKILGLPPLEPRPNGQPANNPGEDQRNGQGGVMGFLQGVLDALEPDDEEHRHDIGGQQDNGIDADVNGEDDGVVVEVVIEEVIEAPEGAAGANLIGVEHLGPLELNVQYDLDNGERPQLRPVHPDDFGGEDGHAGDRPNLQPARPVQAGPPDWAPPLADRNEHEEHEAPQAPPAGRPGLNIILSSVSNAMVSALILPGISFAMGELLRLALPRSWTAAARSPWFRPGTNLGKPGLLQQQWGRSLVGGCLFMVLKDALRLYTKQSKASQTTKQRLALAICDFLNTSATDGSLDADDRDSVDVAVNCIAEVFKVDPTDQAPAVGSQSLLQIYSVYENLKAATDTKPANPAAAPSTGVVSDEQRKQADALKSKGNGFMAEKKYKDAVDYYTQALAINPANAVFLSNRAAAYSADKDHMSAKADAEAAVAIDPAYTKAWSRLGLARFALGDSKGAMDAYAQGIEHEGNGGSFAMQKGFETAKRRFEEMQADEELLPRSSPGVAPGGGAPGGAPPGMPDLGSLAAMFGGGGGGGAGGAGGGMPDLSSIMSNPMFASMAQNLMSNPEMMGSLMNNPRLKEMASSFGSGGGMPDMGSLMSDPDIANMARNMMGGGGGAGSPGAPGGPSAPPGDQGR
ncbi:hypothetical protein G7046_g7890 [Stylonectria norvegica]|nr:hypothetical protein G7046_g7890 [Stylonectria norvegica]